jgi:hypothetical protein
VAVLKAIRLGPERALASRRASLLAAIFSDHFGLLLDTCGSRANYQLRVV